MVIRTGWIIALAALVGLAGRAEAASLKVSPGRFIIHDVNPGVQYDVYKETGLRITIFNDDDVSRTWVLAAYRPSERGKWERGYGEIPDAKWCWFDKNEITIDPKNRGYANLFLKVPEGEKYFNQHWVVTLGINGKPGPGGIALAADVRVQIETRSVPNVKERPDGLLAAAPSIIQFENASFSKKQVSLFNNDSKAHSYLITPLFNDKQIDQTVYLTGSYNVMPDSGWLTFPSQVDIAPGGTAPLDVEFRPPDGKPLGGGKWESILLIQSDEGLSNILRVRAVTTDGKKTE